MELKIQDVLPKKQIKILTPAARKLTQKELNHIMSNPGSDHHNLSQEDINSITKLAITRINDGQTIFGFPTMSIDLNNDDEAPNRNW